ncbi:MAG: DUF4126 domain-containing protein [Verrucomicrobia bacterium]|nr:DUF4126 domain-containing protein [Verrucomicrobiota bacterium]
MDIIDQLSIALGLATLAGLNLYLTVLITGLAVRLQWVELLPEYQNLDVLAHPAVLIAAGVFFLLEFFSDKVPWVDSLWDAVHTLIRPVGGALLAVQTLGETEPAYNVIIALLAGGATLTSHGFKASTRLAINASPEPVSNVVVSVAEDAVVLTGLGLMTISPKLVGLLAVTFLLLVIFFAPRLLRRIRAFFSLFYYKLTAPASDVESCFKQHSKLTSDEDVVLTKVLNGNRPNISWAAACVTGQVKKLPGLRPNFRVKIATESSTPNQLHFLINRRGGIAHQTITLKSLEVTHEPRFLSEDVALYSHQDKRKLVLRFHRGERQVAEKVVQRLEELRDLPERLEEKP